MLVLDCLEVTQMARSLGKGLASWGLGGAVSQSHMLQSIFCSQIAEALSISSRARCNSRIVLANPGSAQMSYAVFRCLGVKFLKGNLAILEY